MPVGSTQAVAALGIITFVGIVFTGFGYDLKDSLLNWIGWIAGAGVGGLGGWLLLPYAMTELTMEQHLIGTGALLVGGAVVGRIFIRLVSRLAIVVTGFVATSAATLVFFTGGTVIRIIARRAPDVRTAEEMNALIEALMNTPIATNQQYLIIVAIAGLTGAILAARFYDIVVTSAITVFGAVLLNTAITLWQKGALESPSALTDVEIAVSGQFAVILAIGLLFQFYRHREDLDIPGISG